jgi:hypothetical protein
MLQRHPGLRWPMEWTPDDEFARGSSQVASVEPPTDLVQVQIFFQIFSDLAIRQRS